MALRSTEEADLLAYLGALRRRKWLIFLTVVLVVGAALALSFVETPIYEARARLLIQPDHSILNSGLSVDATPDFIASQMQVIASPAVQALVHNRLGAAPNITTGTVGTSSIVEIRAQSVNPATAATVANAYVESYLAYRHQQANDALSAATIELQTKIDGLQKQIDSLGNQLAALPACTSQAGSGGACSQRATLQQDRDAALSQQVPLKQQLDQLQVNGSTASGGAQVVLRATNPTRPIRPQPVRNGLLALGVGLVLGVILALAFEYFDDSIKGKEDLEPAVGKLSTLAVIPSIPGWKEVADTRLIAQTDPTSAAAEAYRTMRTSINFLALDRPLRTIQVTSAMLGEGKTTTAANLAVVLAQAGERVIVVSCDLRRPRLHKFFGASNDIGFTSVLLGKATLDAALQPVASEGRLWVMASGPMPPNPSELLSSERAGEVFAGLRDRADIVIIDSPPVLPVTDAAVLATKVDGTLLIVTVGSSTHKRVARAVEMLRQVDAPLIGVLLNRAEADRSYGDTYRYYEAQTGDGVDGNGANHRKSRSGSASSQDDTNGNGRKIGADKPAPRTAKVGTAGKTGANKVPAGRATKAVPRGGARRAAPAKSHRRP